VNVRLVALDLDGTLLDTDDRVSEANARAVARVRERGIIVVLATSRWYELARRNAEELGVSAPLICHNGALVRTLTDGRDLLRLEIPPEPALDVVRFIDAAGYTAITTVGDVAYVRWWEPLDPSRLLPGMRPADRHAPFVGKGASSFLVFGEEGADAVFEAFAEKYRGVLNVAKGGSETYPPYLNIVHAEADKGRALALVCKHLGVRAQEVMAMGDAGPDVSMLEFAGLGVAVGNAAPEVKAAADVVAPPNTEDGVAWALERYILS
jgi:hydroxymethylpyrimidine pyrophosphatase-like HAD family hydrolase